jgi:dsRNA-specific ribonuclease
MIERSHSNDRQLGLLIQRLDSRYGVKRSKLNNKTLAFYCDAVLDMIIVDRIKDWYGTNITADELTYVRSRMVNNRQLLEF